MLSKEDSRRLAQLERQLWREDPDFCGRMSAGRPGRKRIPLILVVGAMAIWTAALVIGVAGWWIAAVIAAGCATVIVAVITYRYRSGRRTTTTWDHRRPGSPPPAW